MSGLLSAWKKNNVDKKVAALKAEIDESKANDSNKGNRRKGQRGNKY
jgi:hypothetical protein